ncbi:hypothetical protein BJX70DRAFT_353591 [Aspergillus crustosus]
MVFCTQRQIPTIQETSHRHCANPTDLKKLRPPNIMLNLSATRSHTCDRVRRWYLNLPRISNGVQPNTQHQIDYPLSQQMPTSSATPSLVQ